MISDPSGDPSSQVIKRGGEGVGGWDVNLASEFSPAGESRRREEPEGQDRGTEQVEGYKPREGAWVEKRRCWLRASGI